MDELAESVDELEEDICVELRRAGVLAPRVVRIYPPYDTGEESIVLVLGHLVPGDREEPLTARMRSRCAPVVTRGW